jgi:hypothetical protein
MWEASATGGDHHGCDNKERDNERDESILCGRDRSVSHFRAGVRLTAASSTQQLVGVLGLERWLFRTVPVPMDSRSLARLFDLKTGESAMEYRHHVTRAQGFVAEEVARKYKLSN